MATSLFYLVIGSPGYRVIDSVIDSQCLDDGIAG
jgi:hypothetical protein